MNKRLPEHIQPFRACQSGLVYEGVVSVASMQRLTGLIAESSGVAQAELRFGVDEEKNPVVTGTIRVDLRLQCQRCMAVYDHPMRLKVGLALTRSVAQSEKTTSRYEPYVAAAEDVSLYEMIEDELILNLPIVPRHAGNTCTAVLDSAWHPSAPERANPFSVLAQIKK